MTRFTVNGVECSTTMSPDQLARHAETLSACTGATVVVDVDPWGWRTHTPADARARRQASDLAAAEAVAARNAKLEEFRRARAEQAQHERFRAIGARETRALLDRRGE